MKTIEKILNPKEKVSDLSLDELIAIARNGFGTEMTREDIVNHIINIDILYLLKYKNELVGFSSYDLHEFNGNKILYLSGIVLRRDMQKNGFFKDTNKIALSEIKPKYFTMKTQNPVIYGATKNLVSKIYPNGEIIPENINAKLYKLCIFVKKSWIYLDLLFCLNESITHAS